MTKMDNMFVSILIPVKKDNKYLRECIEHCLQLDYPEFEIVVLPDDLIELPYKDKVRIIPTGSVGPAQKRDMVIKDIKGEIIAFIDDDAYPKKDWLRNAVDYFTDETVAAVCGPAVTPESDNLRQKASGLVYLSILVSGAHNRRYVPQFKCEVDDFPSCNFLIKKDVFKQIGGFNTDYWPGEDTVLCLKVTKELKKKIIYDPAVLVYHHRRPLFIPHLKQIKSYALHRGYFVKKFPVTSFRLSYFIPSIFVLGLIGGGLLALINPAIKFFYFGIMDIYVVLVALMSLRGTKCRSNLKKGIASSAFGLLAMTIRLTTLVFLGTILTHLTYGIYFIKGMFSKRLIEER